jgi:hypothetical protein
MDMAQVDAEVYLQLPALNPSPQSISEPSAGERNFIG